MKFDFFNKKIASFCLGGRKIDIIPSQMKKSGNEYFANIAFLAQSINRNNAIILNILYRFIHKRDNEITKPFQKTFSSIAPG